jgi:hypothetical protein
LAMTRLKRHASMVVDAKEKDELLGRLVKGRLLKGNRKSAESAICLSFNMSVIHELSQATPLPELDIFGVPPTQTSIERTYTTEHRPIAALDSSASIQFEIHTGIDEYIQFRDTELYLRLKIKLHKANAQAIVESDWDKVSPVNYLLHSLFKQVDVEIGDKQITLSPQTYAYRSYFEGLLGFKDDAKKSYLSAALWSNDSPKDKPDANLSAVFKTTSAVSKEVELMGKLHLDITFQERALLGGSTVILRLHPHAPTFYLMVNDENIKPKVEFTEASLFVQRAKVSPLVVEAHNQALTMSPAKYPITHCQVKTFTINNGTIDAMIDNIVSGQMPRRAYVALVPNDAYNGTYTKNPYNFKHYDVNFIACYLDGVQYPTKAYQSDFEKKLYIREMVGL